MAAAAAGSSFIIRVRGPTGTWRVSGLSPKSTVGALKKKIAAEHGVPLQEQRIHLDRGCKDTPCPVKKTLAQIGLRHGSMVYIKFDATKVSVVAEKSSKRVIAEDGSLILACLTFENQSSCAHLSNM